MDKDRYTDFLLEKTFCRSRRLVPACLIISVLASGAKIELEKIQMPHEVVITPVVMGIVSVFISLILFRDIAERKEIERRYCEFYSTVSPELRSPQAISKAIIETRLTWNLQLATTFWFALPCSLDGHATKDEQLETVRFEPLKEEDLLK